MAFPTVPTLPFVPGTDSIPSSVLNAWRTFFPSCLDADGGGTYTNTTPIIWDTGSAEHQYKNQIALLGRKRRRPRVVITDANATIDTSQGDYFEFVVNAVSPMRTIVVRQTTAPLPAANEIITVGAVGLPSNFGARVEIQREGGIILCTFVSTSLGNISTHVDLESVEVSPGVFNWRVAGSSGVIFDTVASNMAGVVMGAGA